MGNYLSPIALKRDGDTIEFRQCHKLRGHNCEAVYDAELKIFKVQDRVILKVRSQRYQLSEYHFHVPGEHEIEGKIYPAEVHYVFEPLAEDQECLSADHKCRNICGCHHSEEHDAEEGSVAPLVVARAIKDEDKVRDLTKFPVIFPPAYFQYDGAFTSGENQFAPVRWIVGDWPITYNVAQLVDVAKPATALEPTNGRMVLYRRYHK